MPTRAVVAGIGESTFSRRSPHPFAQLQADAIFDAIADAGLRPGDIDAVFSDGQNMPRTFSIETVQATLGLDTLRDQGYYVGVGAGLAMALARAVESVESGRSSHALVYFGVDWGTNVRGPYGFHDRFQAKLHYEYPQGFFGQPLYYATYARRYALEHGIKMGDLKAALGALAIRQRDYALKNGNAQMTKPLTAEEYDGARTIADPLSIFDCCLISDGACALVVTSENTARQSTDHRPVGLLGWGFGSQPITDESFFTQNPALPDMPAAVESGRVALAQAGLTVDDLDFAEIYDCFTISLLIQLEALGLCERGGAVDAILGRGETPLLDRIAVNTHGGCLSQAYLLGANHLTEAVKQLRGDADAQVEGASIGAVAMAPYRDHSTLILGGR